MAIMENRRSGSFLKKRTKKLPSTSKKTQAVLAIERMKVFGGGFKFRSEHPRTVSLVRQPVQLAVW
jgi:hypothetical protein